MIIAAGSIAADDWVRRSPRAARRVVLSVAIVAKSIIGAVITLPLLPASHVAGPVGDLNHEAGETIGWESFVEHVAAAAELVPARQRPDLIYFTADYGQAGAIDRYGPARGIGPACSGHNSYADFRIPAGSAGPVLVVGYEALADRNELFQGCRLADRIDAPHGIENDVDGAPLWLCDRPAEPWRRLWPHLRHEG